MKKLILLLLLLTPVIALLTGGLAVLYNLPFDTRERSPVQPLAFNHKIHAGDNQINCLYCHRFAQVSSVAGIPDMDLCRSCHLFIAAERPGVKRLMSYIQNREVIPWVRINTLPDHVYFPHRMHLHAGIDCSYCHGQVAAMEQVTRTASLKMGWCLNCHRKNDASIDCWTCHI